MMQLMFRGFMILCVGLFIMTRTGVTDEVEKQKLALEVFKVMNFEQMMEQTSQAITPQLIAVIKKDHPDLKDDLVNKIVAITSEEFIKLKPELMLFTGQALVKHYNEDDLRNLIAFYKSDTGQKALRVLPQITQEMNQWVGPRIGQVLKSIKARILSEVKIPLDGKL